LRQHNNTLLTQRFKLYFYLLYNSLCFYDMLIMSVSLIHADIMLSINNQYFAPLRLCVFFTLTNDWSIIKLKYRLPMN